MQIKLHPGAEFRGNLHASTGENSEFNYNKTRVMGPMQGLPFSIRPY